MIGKADIKIREMTTLEAEMEEGESEDKDYLTVQRDLVDDHEQMRATLKEHFRVSHEIGQMASLIIRERPEVAVKGDKVKEYAELVRDKSEKDDTEISEKVAQWKDKNRRWLRRKKKRKGMIRWRHQQEGTKGWPMLSSWTN